MDFPTHLFSARQQRYYLTGRSVSGGQSISGIVQTVNTSGGGLWIFEFSNAALNTREKLLTWRAWEADLDDGVGTAVVPICDFRQAPVIEVNGKPYYGGSAEVGPGIPHGPDDALFADEVGYQQTGLASSDVVAVSDAPLRATAVRIQTVAGPIRPGQHFSVTHADPIGRRMYRIGRRGFTDLNGGLYDVKIRPPLRAAIAADTVLDFRAPSCTMKVAQGGQMAPAVESLKWARGSVTFIEAFD